MIDLHTHTFLSDGALIPSELARRAEVLGCEAIALTDHSDHSNVDQVLSSLKKVSYILSENLDIFVIIGVELTYVPPVLLKDMVSYVRAEGAEIVVVHGETPVEPVTPGTNRAAIEAGCDILAHPGHITEEDALLASKKGVFLELTSRKGHNKTNLHVFETALEAGAKLVVNTDTHMPSDMMTLSVRDEVVDALTSDTEEKEKIFENSGSIARKIKKLRFG